jgi:hypothetical protein
LVKIPDIDHRFGGDFFRVDVGVAVKNHTILIVSKKKTRGNLPKPQKKRRNFSGEPFGEWGDTKMNHKYLSFSTNSPILV